MGRSRYRVLEQQAPHFLTLTVLNWIPLFTRPATVEILLEALRWRQQHRGWQVYGWVVLENHLHLIAQADGLSDEVAAFKSWTARQLIDWLTAHQVTRILNQLMWFKKAHKTDRTHQLWEEGSHPQAIQSDDMMRQKLDYIHNNPVKRGYVDLPEHWRYSSARVYAGQPGLLEVDRSWWTG
jgi:putative transposase